MSKDGLDLYALWENMYANSIALCCRLSRIIILTSLTNSNYQNVYVILMFNGVLLNSEIATPAYPNTRTMHVA